MNERNYKKVKAGYPAETDPLWVSCHAAIGHMPSAGEFTLWRNARWNEFAANNGFIGSREAYETENTGRAFKEWIEYTVSNCAPTDWKQC
jgi:hypothetical protein